MIFIPCQWGICQVLKLQLHHSGSNCFLRAASKGVPDGRSKKYQSQRWFDMSRNNKAINDRFMRVWPQSLGVWKVVPGTSTANTIKQLNIPSMSKLNQGEHKQTAITRVAGVTKKRNIMTPSFSKQIIFPTTVTWYINFSSPRHQACPGGWEKLPWDFLVPRHLAQPPLACQRPQGMQQKTTREDGF